MKISNEIIKKILSSERLVFFTGAGISAESGIPIFRGKNGIWNKLKPEELANFDSFLKNPALVSGWYRHRREIVCESKPNAGHLAIAEMEKYFPDVKVITQNVDNLHNRAGSKIVYELHGNIERNYCIKCKKIFTGDLPFEEKIPRCDCGGLIRPDVVWFGEYLPEDQFKFSENAAENADVFFIIGTSAIVYPAASLIYTAKESGAYLIEINIESTEISRLADISLSGKSGEILPQILECLKGKLTC
jgi:NAD-dependent protein deacetylase/lipoamidase